MKTKEINILFCCERFSAEVRTGGKPGHLILSKTVPLLGSKAADQKQVGTESSAYLHGAKSKANGDRSEAAQGV